MQQGFTAKSVKRNATVRMVDIVIPLEIANVKLASLETIAKRSAGVRTAGPV